jgi:hypothetical protein
MVYAVILPYKCRYMYSEAKEKGDARYTVRSSQPLSSPVDWACYFEGNTLIAPWLIFIYISSSC